MERFPTGNDHAHPAVSSRNTAVVRRACRVKTVNMDSDTNQYDSSGIPLAAEHREAVADEQPRHTRRYLLPLILFLLTCGSTYVIGGPIYSICVMTILLAHEFGHFLQAVRYHVPASLPFLIPMPLPPLGTMGAVIGMPANIWNRRALFDIGITGPLAGLVPTAIFTVIGLHHATIVEVQGGALMLGEPLLFRWLGSLILGPVPEGQTIMIGPMAMAGWVGFFITALNLIPIGQLDGGHVLYAILRRRAHTAATLLLFGAIGGAIFFQLTGWTLMLLLLIWMGPHHPPTANDRLPLGKGRVALGWITLMFVPLGFTPVPFSQEPPQPPPPVEGEQIVYRPLTRMSPTSAQIDRNETTNAVCSKSLDMAGASWGEGKSGGSVHTLAIVHGKLFIERRRYVTGEVGPAPPPLPYLSSRA